jgi:hypothetical protein
MKTKKIIATLLILAVLASGFSTINAGKGSDAWDAHARQYNYTILTDSNATIPVDGTYEITLQLNQTYMLGGFLVMAADRCPDLIQNNVKVSDDRPAFFYRTIKTGTWSGNLVNPTGITSANYILHVA